MKRVSFLGWVVGLLFVSATLVKGQNDAAQNLHYVIDFQKLSYYLELDDSQKGEVSQINAFFIDQQKQYLRKNLSPEKWEKNWNQVLYGNLKLMKETLSEEQYKKYLRVINATHTNRMLAALNEADNNYAGSYMLVELK
jgi:hypothetical protein